MILEDNEIEEILDFILYGDIFEYPCTDNPMDLKPCLHDDEEETRLCIANYLREKFYGGKPKWLT